MTNYVTNAGLANITAALVAAAAVKYLGWGTGASGTQASNALTSASPVGTSGPTVASTRISGTPSQVTTTNTNDTLQIVGTVYNASGGALAITEVGVFDAAGTGGTSSAAPSGGNMDIYGTFSTINLSNGDSITFTIQAQFTG